VWGTACVSTEDSQIANTWGVLDCLFLAEVEASVLFRETGQCVRSQAKKHRGPASSPRPTTWRAIQPVWVTIRREPGDPKGDESTGLCRHSRGRTPWGLPDLVVVLRFEGRIRQGGGPAARPRLAFQELRGMPKLLAPAVFVRRFSRRSPPVFSVTGNKIPLKGRGVVP